jgi:hypothetical protein
VPRGQHRLSQGDLSHCVERYTTNCEAECDRMHNNSFLPKSCDVTKQAQFPSLISTLRFRRGSIGVGAPTEFMSLTIGRPPAVY